MAGAVRWADETARALLRCACAAAGLCGCGLGCQCGRCEWRSRACCWVHAPRKRRRAGVLRRRGLALQPASPQARPKGPRRRVEPRLGRPVARGGRARLCTSAQTPRNTPCFTAPRPPLSIQRPLLLTPARRPAVYARKICQGIQAPPLGRRSRRRGTGPTARPTRVQSVCPEMTQRPKRPRRLPTKKQRVGLHHASK